VTYTIGGVTLPKNPTTVIVEYGSNTKETEMPAANPFIVSVGDRADKMTWECHVYERGKTLAQLETDYILPLKTLKRTQVTLTVTNRSFQSGSWFFADIKVKERGGNVNSFEVTFVFLKGSRYVIL